MLVGAAAVIVSICISLPVLLQEANKGPDAGRADRRLQAIRTALSVGVGVGAAAGLLLAARRQQLHERTQVHQEDVAAAAEFDATQRRITELYAKAVDQLVGDDKAPVRLGGLHALERLAQNEPDHRQTVVDVICAYLRMPKPDPSYRGAGEEHEVRRSAQQILADHLHPAGGEGIRWNPTTDRFWDGIRLNLAGANLTHFNLSGAAIAEASFNEATFTGAAVFNGTEFAGPANFGAAAFYSGGHFYGATFGDQANFVDASFTLTANFTDAHFAGPVHFDQASFVPTPEIDSPLLDLSGAQVITRAEPSTPPSTWPAGWTVDATGALKQSDEADAG